MHTNTSRGPGLLACIGLGTLLLSAAPAQAHHLLDVTNLQPNALNGWLSGLAHPVLGPDHLVFLLALALLGLQRQLPWVLGLLGVGLAGSVAGLLWPGLPGAEALVSLSLVLEALVLLKRVPAALLLPAMAVHGYVLSATVLGWTAMPVSTYLLGLLMSQGLLLVLAITGLAQAGQRLSNRWRPLMAAGLAGLGGFWVMSAVIA